MPVDNYFPDDTPLFPSRKEAYPRHVRVRPKPRKVRDMGIRALDKRQRQALKNYEARGAVPEVKKVAAMEAGYTERSALKAINNLLARRPIVEALDNAGGTDEKIAQKMVEGLESEHPLKPGRPDPHAIHKFVQEHNKVKGNYAPTKVSMEKKSQVMVVHLTAGNIEAFNKFQKMREEDGT